jgi:hypothetical protein
MYPLGYGTAWMEGDISETGFIDKFKHEFGDKAGMWLRMIMKAFKDSADIQKLYNKLVNEDTLARHFGSQFSSVNVTPGGPYVYVASINVSSNKESYNIIKGNLRTFDQAASLVSPTVDVGSVSLRDVASLITTKEDRVESKRLKKGFIRQKGHYIGGTVNFSTGKLTSLSMPQPTAAHVLANKGKIC